MQYLSPIVRNIIPIRKMRLSLIFILSFSVMVGTTVFANIAYHSLILKSDGSLHAFGMNSYGQLGDGCRHRNTPTQILASGVSQIAGGYNHSLILKSDGSLHTFGRNNYGQLGMVRLLTKTLPLKFSLLGFHKLRWVLPLTYS